MQERKAVPTLAHVVGDEVRLELGDLPKKVCSKLPRSCKFWLKIIFKKFIKIVEYFTAKGDFRYGGRQLWPFLCPLDPGSDRIKYW